MTTFSLVALLSVVLALALLPETQGFLQVAPHRSKSTSSALFSSRREVVGAGFTAAILASGLPAHAEDGKVVALQVDNLDGVPGKTGTIKIQLHPEWAPNGVKRFEVSKVGGERQ